MSFFLFVFIDYFLHLLFIAVTEFPAFQSFIFCAFRHFFRFRLYVCGLRIIRFGIFFAPDISKILRLSARPNPDYFIYLSVFIIYIRRMPGRFLAMKFAKMPLKPFRFFCFIRFGIGFFIFLTIDSKHSTLQNTAEEYFGGVPLPSF